ncbi:MAG: translocation/assembly module TamB domain-containing protein, partial [Pseudazoarcus pumilus]|nr:translocation/assembly module TamB domain-containing protein [Pseudazoarcus pumilus]
SGRLIGPLSFDSLRVESPDLRIHADTLQLDWRPLRLLAGKLHIDRLQLDSLRLATRPSDAPNEALQMPQIALPVLLEAELQVDRIVLEAWNEDGTAPLAFSGFTASLSGEGAVQRVDALQLTTPWGRTALRGSLDTGVAPHGVMADGTAQAVLDGREFILSWSAQGDLSALALRADGAGGQLSGEVTAQLAPFEVFPLLGTQVALQGFDPAAFIAGAPSAELALDATLAPGADGVLEGDVAVRNAQPLRVDQGGLPFESLTAHVRASLEQLDLSAMALALVGDGRLSGEAVIGLPAAGRPLSVTAALSATDIDPVRLHAAAPQGRVALDAQAAFDAPDRLRLDFRLGDGRLFGMALGGAGQLELAGLRVPKADLKLQLGPSRLLAKGAWGAPGDVLDLDASVRRLDRLGFGLAGSAELAATLSGTPAAPAGRFRLSAEALRLPDGTSVARIAANGEAADGIDGAMALKLDVSGIGKDDARWVERLRASLDGTRLDHALKLDAATPEGDRLRLALEGGQPEGGDLAWSGTLASLRLQGRLPLELEAPAALSVSPERAELAPARFKAGEEGRVVLDETVWSPGNARLLGHLTGLAVVEPGRRGNRGPGPLTLGAEWEIELAEQADANLRVFRESGDISIPGELSARIGLQHLEAVVVASGERLAASLDARGTEMGTLSGSATALLERDDLAGWGLAQDADLLGSVRFDMPSVAWLSRLLQQETVLDGALRAEFSFSGTPARPVARGRISGDGLSMTLVEHGIQLSGGELLAEFERDRLYLRKLDFVSPNRVRPPDRRIPFEALTAEPGRLTSSGEIALDSGEGRFRFEADRLPILQRSDRWLIMSGSGEARSTWTSLDLQADFRADAGYIEFAESPPPSLSDDVVILGSEEPAGGAGLKLTADVTVSLGDALYLSALGLDTRLAGALQLQMRPGEALSASGSISTAGGIYRGYGQNLAIERGVINFQGALDNPGLNVVALRKGLAVEAGVAVTGSARRPQVRLVSQPDVPDPDKLSWIVLGRAPTAGGGADLSLLLPAAQALLGGPGGGMTEQLSRSLGFDEFGIGQSASGVGRVQTSRVVGSGTTVTGEGELSGQVLTLGKRLGEDLTVSFEQSLSGAESLVLLTYRLTRHVSVVARGGSDNAADIYYTISFR